MLYKRISILLIILGFTFSFGQTYRLEYQFNNYIAVFGETRSLNTTLDYDEQTKESLYKVILKDLNSKAEIKNSNVIVLDTEEIDNELVYSNFNTSEMVIQTQIDIEMMLFTEKIPEIKWNLINESRTENNLKLNKATATFRGRNYTVWYTLDIPVNVGPWKLHGLPGAIVTVEEDKGRYSWQLTGFKKLEDSTIKNPLENKSYKVKDIKDYPKLKFELSERMIAKIKQIGVNATIPKRERSDLELKFEWEK
ncbi:GLPGLI family protein [Faecalibacter bovis]|uniref:GLPGLI family protein n=1 Tax=Faecalibacter bovis TaxID=2898187 RepID=A0ABX7XEK1_9FLAO|nr:GLPGLI family protein [Faecalibacter bovis]QTV06387.1 GLPGLI family protein [Faecalibacter bovis]